MVDEIFDRDYAAGRKALNASLSNAIEGLARTVRSAFEVLVKIEYEAPWTAKSKRVRYN